MRCLETVALVIFISVMFAAIANVFGHGGETFRSEASWDPLYRAPEPARHRALPAGPSTSIALNAASFRPGQQLALGLSASNTSENAQADLFVGVLLPDGNTLAFVSASGPLAAGTTLNNPGFLQFTFPSQGVPYWGEQLDSPVSNDVNHEGYDFLLPEGTPVMASAAGIVVFAGLQAPFFCPPLGRNTQGLGVTVEHVPENGARYQSTYGHFSRVDVQAGQSVVTGQPLGLSGNTGCSGGPHLHFEVFHVDPVAGRRITTDPYGWEGSYPDPWEIHPQGIKSVWLWRDGAAPAIFRGSRLLPNPNPTNMAPVALTAWRWMGIDDSHNPNNEFVEITLDPRFAAMPTRDLSDFTLRNNRGDVFHFPPGFHIQVDRPVLVYTGPGVSTDTVLFWGLGAGVWNNARECARLVYPGGGAYALSNASGACN